MQLLFRDHLNGSPAPQKHKCKKKNTPGNDDNPKRCIKVHRLTPFFAFGDQGGSFRENRPPGPPTKAFDYFVSFCFPMHF
jgi:hypothetical protein